MVKASTGRRSKSTVLVVPQQRRHSNSVVLVVPQQRHREGASSVVKEQVVFIITQPSTPEKSYSSIFGSNFFREWRIGLRIRDKRQDIALKWS